MSNPLAIVYMNRACRRHCPQCSIRNAPGKGITDLAVWKRVMRVVENMSSFTIVLGNDPWLFGPQLAGVFSRPTAVYTTAVRDGWGPISVSTAVLLDSLRNFSCGYDYPGSQLSDHESDHNKRKARDAWLCMKEIADSPYFKHRVERYMSVTLHRYNAHLVKDILADAKAVGAYLSFSFLNYNLDGQFDFMPGLDVLEDWLISRDQFHQVRDFVMELPKEDRDRFYIWETFQNFTFEQMTRMQWHCRGNPYGGPTVDFDGTLRVCGYRKGVATPQVPLEALTTEHGRDQWRKAIVGDCRDCPGCSWSCPMVYAVRGLREKDRQWVEGDNK